MDSAAIQKLIELQDENRQLREYIEELEEAILRGGEYLENFAAYRLTNCKCQ